MPAQGRPWRRERGYFREKCKAANTPCWICLKPIEWYAKASTPMSFSADHVTPTSLGGADTQDNLRAAHFGCNSSRGNTTRGMFPTARQW